MHFWDGGVDDSKGTIKDLCCCYLEILKIILQIYREVLNIVHALFLENPTVFRLIPKMYSGINRVFDGMFWLSED